MNNRNRRNLNTKDFCTCVMFVNCCKARTRSYVLADLAEEGTCSPFQVNTEGKMEARENKKYKDTKIK